jgi:hypothetical protein
MPGLIVVGSGESVSSTSGDPRWDLYLAESDNLEIIAPLFDATGISLDLSLNKPGRMTFQYPLDGPLSVELGPVRRAVVLVYNGVIYWSGYINNISKSLPSESVQIVVNGWLELLYHRELREKVTYTNQTRGFIIHDLLAAANGQQFTWIEQGTNTDDAPPIDKTFEESEVIGQGIDELTSIEAGPDVTIDPEFRTMDIKAWDEYVDRTGVIWAYGWGPANVNSFTQNISSDNLVNRLSVQGKNSGVTGYLAEDILSQNSYNLFESSVTLSSVSDFDILAAYGEAEIAYRGKPRVTYEFQPAAGHTMPLIFRDFQLGDKCYLKAKFKNKLEVDQAIRIFSCNLNIDPEGNPKMSNMVTVAT